MKSPLHVRPSCVLSAWPSPSVENRHKRPLCNGRLTGANIPSAPARPGGNSQTRTGHHFGLGGTNKKLGGSQDWSRLPLPCPLTQPMQKAMFFPLGPLQNPTSLNPNNNQAQRPSLMLTKTLQKSMSGQGGMWELWAVALLWWVPVTATSPPTIICDVHPQKQWPLMCQSHWVEEE